MNTLILYSTSACHLCETAKTIILPELVRYQLELEEVDVSESDELIERYGEKIPVLALTSHELNWPFSHAQFLAFIENSI